MIPNQVSQEIVVLYATMLGLILGIVYDIYKVVIRLLFGQNKIATITTDIFYMCITAVITFAFALAYNFGIVRYYILGGELIGLVIYKLTIGKLLSKILNKISLQLRLFYIRQKERIAHKIGCKRAS